MSETGKLVLVTGASGFIATHIVKQLQEAGYRVRGTVRSLSCEVKCKPLRELCRDATYPLELVEADLTSNDGWKEAVKDCDYVIHTACPFPVKMPTSEEELLQPAVEGTLKVLKAINEGKTVKRCVLTSSIAAVFGTREHGVTYNEENWTDPETPGVHIYSKSKTLAEKAAWKFVKDKDFELVVINPVATFGPVLCGGEGTIVTFIKKLLNREIPMLPNYSEGAVDVRDVAKAHIVAMTLSDAAGNRFCLCTQQVWFKDIANILSEEFRSQGYNIPTTVAPNWMMWIMSFFDKDVGVLYPNLGKVYYTENDKMTKVLGIQPTDVQKSFIDMAYSMVERGFVEKTNKYKGHPSDITNE